MVTLVIATLQRNRAEKMVATPFCSSVIEIRTTCHVHRGPGAPSIAMMPVPDGAVLRTGL